MDAPYCYLTASQAAARLGVSGKALRIYERHGLLAPGRTAAGWRVYDRNDVKRGASIASLRRLGLSLAQIGRVLDGVPGDLDAGLAAHEAKLEKEASQIAQRQSRVRVLRDELRCGRLPALTDVNAALERDNSASVGFALPWPWAGEWFALRNIRPLTFITGPLGSGKTRFAKQLAESLPDATFLGLDRRLGNTIQGEPAVEPARAQRVESALSWLEDDGARRTDALAALIGAIEACTSQSLVVDMVEQGLDRATQEALVSYFRARIGQRPALFLMTRSSSVLDLADIRLQEPIIFCPANHNPPFLASSRPGERGYESLATCLAAPEVRVRIAHVPRNEIAAS